MIANYGLKSEDKNETLTLDLLFFDYFDFFC